MSQADILHQLPGAIARAENLPSPPTVAVRVLRLTSDENATIEDLTKIISRDPALSLKILKLANSSLFRRASEVTSLDQATLRLGLKTVKLMALSFSLANDLPRKGDTRGFDYFGYWRRSLTMAVAGRGLARLVKKPNGDEAFLCGLLGRIGQLVLAQCLPERYAPVIARAEGELPPASLEKEILGYDFHQVGAALLDSWELPGSIAQTVRHWGDPDAVPEGAHDSVRNLARIMHLADHTTGVICSAHRASALRRLHERAREFFGVSEDEVDSFIISLDKDVAELASLLNVDVDQESYRSIVDRARMDMVQLSLGTAIDLQRTASRAEELEQKNRELRDLATTDKLTGIPNRARFDQLLDRVVEARLESENENELGLLMVDVDHFKTFNDTYGHPLGDEVLRLVARSLVSVTRDTDIAARYGGEEFVVILPNTTLEDLQRVAERVRTRIAQTDLEHEGSALNVTVSVGGACLERIRQQKDGMALLSLADECLYAAKRTGRNRSVCRQVESAGGVES